MEVRLTLSGPLRRHYRRDASARSECVVLTDGARVGDLLAGFSIPPETIHWILVNRRRAAVDIRLADGDHVWLLPLAAGG